MGRFLNSNSLCSVREYTFPLCERDPPIAWRIPVSQLTHRAEAIANRRLVSRLTLVRLLLHSHCLFRLWPEWTVNLLSAAHHLAWAQHPTIWLCESCAILWLVVRAVRSSWVRIGVLFMLAGLTLNALVTDANAGVMPVVGMPPTLHPVSPMWHAATSKTQLVFLADQAQLGLFSIGDLVMIFGGVLIVAICLRRALGSR